MYIYYTLYGLGGFRAEGTSSLQFENIDGEKVWCVESN